MAARARVGVCWDFLRLQAQLVWDQPPLGLIMFTFPAVTHFLSA